MSLINRVILLAASLGLGACAIHPLPEDVTGVKTTTIVHKIRCEARDAIINARIAYLQRTYPEVVDLDSMRQRIKQGVKPLIKYNLDYFSATGIVYAFTLDATETDTATFNADVIKPLTHGTATFTPTAGNTLMRENIRTFTISDSFGGLISVNNDKYCKAIGQSYANVEYPIVGRVGVDEMVTTFITLTLFDTLSAAADSDAPKVSSNVPNAMADSLAFKTTIMAGLQAAVMFMPMGQSLQLLDATLPLSAMRVDNHQVIIGLGLPGPYTPPGTASPARSQAFGRWNTWRSANLAANNNPHLIIANPSQGATGEAVALEAVNNQILRFEVPKSLIIVP